MTRAGRARRWPPAAPRATVPILAGILFGMVVGMPAIILAIMSAGAGHGDYLAARALFPLPLLLSRLEGAIGPISGTLALLQFPLYGALLGWSRWRKSFRPLAALALLHLVAALACFSGALPDFS